MNQDYRYYEDSNGKWTVQGYRDCRDSGGGSYWYDIPRQCDTEADAIAMIKRLRADDGFKPDYKYVSE